MVGVFKGSTPVDFAGQGIAEVYAGATKVWPTDRGWRNLGYQIKQFNTSGSWTQSEVFDPSTFYQGQDQWVVVIVRTRGTQDSTSACTVMDIDGFNIPRRRIAGSLNIGTPSATPWDASYATFAEKVPAGTITNGIITTSCASGTATIGFQVFAINAPTGVFLQSRQSGGETFNATALTTSRTSDGGNTTWTLSFRECEGTGTTGTVFNDPVGLVDFENTTMGTRNCVVFGYFNAPAVGTNFEATSNIFGSATGHSGVTFLLDLN